MQARYKDYIAFGFDLSLLRRASLALTATMAILNASAACPSASPARVTCTCFRLQVLSAATRNDVDTVEMKLTLRNVPSGGDAPDQSRPFLSFSTADHCTLTCVDLLWLLERRCLHWCSMLHATDVYA